jgi:hypothetical protein
MEATMTKTLTMGLTAALIAFSALQPPAALAKDNGNGAYAHQWKGSKFRHFRTGHLGHNRGFDDRGAYKHRHLYVGDDGDGRGVHYGKRYRDRYFRIGHDAGSRGFGYWNWKKTASPFWDHKSRDRTAD